MEGTADDKNEWMKHIGKNDLRRALRSDKPVISDSPCLRE